MKPLFEGNVPKKEDARPDMGAMPIANCKFDCSKCLLRAEGCTFLVNTLNCLCAQKRLKKILDDEKVEEETGEDKDLKAEQDASLADYLKNLEAEPEGEDEDD
jgi:hypothetical protein